MNARFKSQHGTAPTVPPAPRPPRGDQEWDPRNTGWGPKLPFRQWQWARIVDTDVNPLFPRGTVVCLLKTQPMGIISPTVRDQQVNEWQCIPSDTAYRFAKLDEGSIVRLCPCEDYAGSIVHVNLWVPGTNDYKRTKAYVSGEMVTLASGTRNVREYALKWHPGGGGAAQKLPIPRGISGVIAWETTTKAPLPGTTARTPSNAAVNPERRCYVVQFPVRESYMRWVVCNNALPGAYLQPLDERETNQWEAKVLKLQGFIPSAFVDPRVSVRDILGISGSKSSPLRS
ncbi:hypothetical protein C8Q77DRAFT_1075552 [Trametes polyzona]|nr:hypothetical protein C8Q77DRAFT_1075552 [Trametes polyzona]